MKSNILKLTVVAGAVALLAYASAIRDKKIPENAPYVSKASTSSSWMPNETVTGTILAANFAQDQRDWARANLYLDRLTTPEANDAPSVLRMMLLALSAGQFDRAADYAGKMETLLQDNKQTTNDMQIPVGDGRDLATIVLLARDVRGGNLAGAEKRIGDMRSPALVAFIQPVIGSWLRAGLKQPLDAGAEGLSLIQALHRGLAAEWAGQTAVANKIFDTIARAPLTPSGALMVAAYNIRQGRADAARAALSETLRLDPLDADAKGMLEALNQGQSPQLKPQWSYHLQGVTAGVGLAFMDLAQMMMADRATDTALIFAQLGRMIRPDVPGLSLLVSAIFEEQNREGDAAEILASVQTTDVDYTDAQIRLAQLRATDGDAKAAVDILEKLMDNNPSPRVAYALGETERDNKNFSGAVRNYDQVIALSGGKADDDLWSVYFVRAMAYDEMGEWEKAEADLKKALEYRPENPHVLNFLAYSWADKNMHLAEARDMLMRALARAPSDPYITDSLGWVYFRQNDLAQATILLERAVSLKPYDPVLNDHLGDVYAKIGRTLEARYQWQRALDYADKQKDDKLVASITQKLQEK